MEVFFIVITYIFKEQTKKIKFIQYSVFHVTNLQLNKLHNKTLRNQVSVMIYHPSNENVSNNKRNRKQNVIWFNPPFSANVKT